jgi:hypothetical protein
MWQIDLFIYVYMYVIKNLLIKESSEQCYEVGNKFLENLS